MPFHILCISSLPFSPHRRLLAFALSFVLSCRSAFYVRPNLEGVAGFVYATLRLETDAAVPAAYKRLKTGALAEVPVVDGRYVGRDTFLEEYRGAPAVEL